MKPRKLPGWAPARTVQQVFEAALIALLAFSLSGCGVQLLYNRIDQLALWWIDGILDLDNTQRDQLKADLDQLHLWHRNHQLPELRAALIELRQKAPDGLTDTEIQRFEANLERWYAELAEQSLPIAERTLRALSSDQIEALEENFKEYYEESTEDLADMSDAELRQEWAERTQDMIEDRTGRLSRAQRARIQVASNGWKPDRRVWAEYGRLWQRELLELLRDRPPADAFATRLRALWVDAEARYTPELAQLNADNDRLGRELTIELSHTLSERQQQKLRRSLTSLADDLGDLIEQSEALAAAGAP